ncbi:ABC transporter permease [Hamadaea sp. NPDC050747]|uniref:ABC transporter permease n=1 Tax=Hamadaea sp. NPDC050747 TaxID=3155789 RepID=UPI0033FC6E10
MNARYLLLEARAVLRDIRFLVFTVAMPAVLFLVFDGLFGGQAFGNGTQASPALMVSMAGYGAMGAALSTGLTIAVERGSGWLRQLRLTPLSGSGYLTAKTTLSMLVALPPVLLVSALGATVGDVGLTGPQWLGVTLGLWLAVLPFGVLGVALGQLSTSSNAQAMGGALMSLLGLTGGMWIPAEIVPDWMRHVMQATPGFWLREFGLSAFSPVASRTTGLLVLAGWTVAAAVVAVTRFRADVARA